MFVFGLSRIFCLHHVSRRDEKTLVSTLVVSYWSPPVSVLHAARDSHGVRHLPNSRCRSDKSLQLFNSYWMVASRTVSSTHRTIRQRTKGMLCSGRHACEFPIHVGRHVDFGRRVNQPSLPSSQREVHLFYRSETYSVNV